MAQGNRAFLRWSKSSGRFSLVFSSEVLCPGRRNSRHQTSPSQVSPSTVATQHGQTFVPLAFVVITWEPVEKTVDVPRDCLAYFPGPLTIPHPSFPEPALGLLSSKEPWCFPFSQALAMTGDQAWDKGSFFALNTHPSVSRIEAILSDTIKF